MVTRHNTTLAYIIGIALGDGNLSNPNGRAIRLRITCDSKYPNTGNEIESALKLLFPNNKVSIVAGPKPTYFNISVYSNELASIMPWRAGYGSKVSQQARVPAWIFVKKSFMRAALRGLIHTDGSIYFDRGYLMVNFTNVIQPLAEDVLYMMQKLGFNPKISKTMQKSGNFKYTIRLARDVEKFITCINVQKD